MWLWDWCNNCDLEIRSQSTSRGISTFDYILHLLTIYCHDMCVLVSSFFYIFKFIYSQVKSWLGYRRYVNCWITVMQYICTRCSNLGFNELAMRLKWLINCDMHVDLGIYLVELNMTAVIKGGYICMYLKNYCERRWVAKIAISRMRGNTKNMKILLCNELVMHVIIR